MRILNFKKIDAFTNGVSLGNPAGYIRLKEDESLREDEMQKIARELSGFVNEVGYVRKVGDAFDLKFYSSECEVAFCGHAIIAIMYDVLNNSAFRTKDEVFINVKAGKLSVFNQINQEGAVYIMAPEPDFLNPEFLKPGFLKPGFIKSGTGISEISDILGIKSSDIDRSMPVRLVDGGLRTLIVPLTSLSTCLRILPDEDKLKSFCLSNDVDIVHISTHETYTDSSEYRTRVFAPKYGYLEDPATGSGNAAFGYYLIDQNLWNGDLTVEQGPDKTKPNFVKLKRYYKKDKTRMLFGGCGTIRIEGNYYLHDSKPA